MTTKLWTIDNLPDMTAQEVFDTAAKHVLTNGRPSLNRKNCVYSGIGCAAAPFLKPEFTKRADEVGNWMTLHTRNKVPDNHLSLIVELQSCHDDAARYRSSRDSAGFISGFKFNMRNVAERFKLDASILNPSNE